MNKTIKIVINILIFLVVIGFIAYIIKSSNTEERTLTKDPSIQSFKSDYEQLLSIDLKDSVIAFDMHDEQFYIASDSSVSIHSSKGGFESSFKIKSEVRDIKVSNNSIYLLYPTFIENYSLKGDSLLFWEACSDLSNYCSFTIVKDFVFVTDMGNKNICKYTLEGNFVQFIHSPNKFVIPSHFFDITYKNDTIYCVNPGRHLIESYTLNGDFITAIGKTGTAPGYFAGCCNPSYIHFDGYGIIITSEKGNPRITSYTQTGTFNKLILDSSLLGGGYYPFQVKAINNKLYIVKAYQINIYQHKEQ